MASKAGSAGVRGFESPAPTAVADPIAERVLELIAEKTGYPKDMLGLDLDLEADLGVDTVKQAELFALLRETYGFERDEKLQLRDFPTLAHVIKFVHERTRPTASPSPAPISEADAFPRRIPVAVPAPPLDMCASTRVRLDAGARIAVVGAGETATQLVRRLNERGCEVLQVEDAPPSDDLSNRLKAWTATAPVRGLYWLPPLEVEPPIARLDFAAWKEGLRRRVVLLHAAVRALGEQIGPAGTFLVSATALGGRHGYGSVPAAGQMGGAVTGFTKAMRRERPDALVKAVDFGSERRPEVEADQLIEETLFDPANVEVGRTGDERWTVRLEEAPAGQSNLTLGKGSTIVVTGAAGSIVSAIVADLAAATSGTFHLLDLVREPDPSDPDIRRFASDPSGLKLELAERLRARGERPTPGMVEKQLAAIERAHAALSAMESVKAAGGRCFYHSVDITDPVAVARVIDDVRGSSDHIDVLLHAAGVEISHLLPDKEDAEFARVFGVKTDGWFNVLKAAGDMPIGAIIAFSSVAGRFGNAGQTDYSAANDLLCKSVSNLRGVRPDTHAVAIDWTAWAEIGMATRGSIPKLMELAGIEMLPPKVGIPTVRREIMGATSGEVVVAGQLGALLDGADPIDSTRNEWRRRAPLLGNVAFEGPTIRAASIFDPKAQPFLDDHRIEGVSVLPGVMGVELMAELAGLAFPGMAVAAVEDVDFAAPFKFYRDEPREVQLEGQVGEDGGDVVVACRLSGSRTLAGRSEPQATTHFTARVRLSRSRRPAPSVSLPGDGTNSISADAIYKVYFHGPAFRVLEGSWPEGDRVIGRHAAALPALTMPAGGDLVSSPRLVELCFQTVGLLELGKSSRLALPAHIDRLSFYERRAAESPIFAVVNQPDQSNGFSAQVVDPSGRAVIELEGYRTVAIPLAIDVALLEPFRHAVKATVP
ncbi:MAG TPA: SDR family NAD(P)-dependent oxidoreductase [Candidatus Dormibacteraeota bacterium]|nr:SDR family NAD(P)-dependent oxidoreductase [Candidatus Dormibacteraeota bacterium]